MASLPAPHRQLLVLGLLDLLEPWRRPARPLGDPKGERCRVVLLRDAVLFNVAVEVAQLEGGVVIHSGMFAQRSRRYRESAGAMVAPALGWSAGRLGLFGCLRLG